MIKIFGWEPYMLKQLAENRDQELWRLRRFRLLAAAMNIANATAPLLSKLLVIALYVRHSRVSKLTRRPYSLLHQTIVSKGDLRASVIFSTLLVLSNCSLPQSFTANTRS